jgi:hypothetical protein
VLCEHKESLALIFGHFADSEGGIVGKAARAKKLMQLSEWLDMMRDLQLLDAFFTVRAPGLS